MAVEGLHQAIHVGAVDALGLIASAFEDAYRAFIFLLTRRRDGSLLVHHILPLRIEVDQCGDIGFPRFQVIVVHIAVSVVIVVFVGQAHKAVPKLMDDDIAREAIAAGAGAVEIINTATTIFLRVDEDVYLIVWHLTRQVTDVAVVGAHAITFRVEGPEAEAHGRVLVDMVARHGAATLRRWCHHPTDIETLAIPVVRRIAEHTLHKEVAVFNELAHLGLGVAFGKDDDVDSLGDVFVANPCLIDRQV